MMKRTAVILATLAAVISVAYSFSLAVPPPSSTAATTTTTTTTTRAPPLEVVDQLSANVAVILNTNARSVTPDLVPIARQVLGSDAVFVTSTALEAQEAARQISQNKNISMVIPVGGDGTLSSMVNFLVRSELERNRTLTLEQAVGRLPVMGYIPLGTGNGVGSVVGCSSASNTDKKTSLLRRIFRGRKLKRERLAEVLRQLQTVGQELQQAKSPSPSQGNCALSSAELVDLPMMEISMPENAQSGGPGDLCFFAGVGFDSLMLQDFKDLKAWSQRTNILKSTLGSVTGYCVALVTKTLPKCIQRNAHEINVEITSADPETLWVDHRRGDVVQPLNACSSFKEGAVVYKGKTGIVAGGTSPFYGGGLRLFPFARITPNKMHLRVGRIHPLRGFINIPGIFAGSYRDTREESFGCLDFLGDDFTVKVEPEKGGYPLQHSGESVGSYDQFRLRLIKTPIRFVSFLMKRVVKE
jgi:hypothetical protein